MEITAVKGLRAALPYLKHFRGKLFVVKCGGEALDNTIEFEGLIEQIALLHQLGVQIILVHGGGVQATALSKRLGIDTPFVEGRRITSSDAISVMAMALNGEVRTTILGVCRKLDLPAIGVSGIDAGIVIAKKRPPRTMANGATVDFGQVGDIESITCEPLISLLSAGYVPVVTTLASDDSGVVLNINADDVASAIAVALNAEKLILVTKPRGVLMDLDDPQSLISQLTLSELHKLEIDGTIKAGMMPKAQAIRKALLGGVPRIHVISYSITDSLLTEVFTNEGSGTMIVAE